MLASGAHVKIGDQEFQLDEGVEGHYVREDAQLFSATEDLPGAPGGTRNVRPDRLYWVFDDWSGGEGNKRYYADQPTRYYTSDSANGRNPGQLTGPPDRTSFTVAVSDIGKPPFFARALGYLWYASSRETFWIADTTATAGGAGNPNAEIAADYHVTAAAGAEDALYVATFKAADTTRKVLKVTTAATTVVTSETSATVKFHGLALLGGQLYAWNGRKLFQLDIKETLPLTVNSTYRKVYDAGTDLAGSGGVLGGETTGTTYDAGIVATDRSVIMFASVNGRAQVYEYDPIRAGRVLWNPPEDFTIRSITHQLGVVFFGGHFGQDPADGVIYAIPLNTRQPIKVAYVRKDATIYCQEMASSEAAKVLVAGGFTRRVFEYDMELNSISCIDTLGESGDLRIGAIAYNRQHRYAAQYEDDGSGSGNITIWRWKNDEEANRRKNVTVDLIETGFWDFDIPGEQKALLGFHVVVEPMVANQSITISYDLGDGDGYTATTAVTSATSGATDGRVFVPVSTGSTTKKFHRLKFKVVIASSDAAVFTPIIYSITVEGALIARRKTWNLALKVKNEDNQTRPKNRQWNAPKIRDYIEDLAENKNLVTFLDGYRYRDDGDYTTHVVIVEDQQDVIDRNAEGTLRVTLREGPS